MNWLFSLGLHNAVVGALFLALLVWGLTRIWNNQPAAHLMWLLVLVKLVTPPLVNLDLGKWAAAPDAYAPAAAIARPLVDDAHSPHPRPPEIAPGDIERNSASAENPLTIAGNESRPDLPAQPRSSVATLWNSIRPTLMWLWIVGAGLVALLAVIRMVRFQGVLIGTLPASQRIRSRTEELAKRIGLSRAPDVRVVDSAIAPLVWCLGWRATVVLPLRLIAALDEQQISMVLAHELAHLRRRDHWVRMLELIVSALYWWNPLVWWVRRRLHAVEEQCCDAWVAWIYPDQGHEYAESLLKAAELLPAPLSLPTLASPFLNTHTLKERIEIVLKNRSPRTASRLAAIGLALFAVVVIPAGVRGLEEDEPTKPAPVVGPKVPEKKPAVDPVIPKGPPKNATSDKPVAKELQLLQGSFKVDKWRSDKWPAKSEEFQAWQWKIKGREIIWTRPKQDDLRLSFTVDATVSPRQIGLTFLNGPDQGETCLGICLPSRHEIELCFQEPGAKVDRPMSFGSLPGDHQTSLALVPAEILPVGDEVAALQGVWKFDIYYSDWWPERISNPPISWSKWRWTIKGNEIHWSGMKVPNVNLSFTVDPTKSPRQIDMTFLDGPHKGKKLLGMYQFFAEDACYISFADPEAKVKRPTDVAYSRDSGQTMVSIEKVAEEKPAAVGTPPAKERAADRGPEIDAAIARLRKLGAFVREFHPRGDPQYWVQIISTGLGATNTKEVLGFDDANLDDVETIGRGAALQLHLRNTSVTSAGLARLASAARIDLLELSDGTIDNETLKILPQLPLRGSLGLHSDRLTNVGIRPVSECRELTGVSLGGNLTDDSLEHLVGLPKLQSVSLGRRFTRRAFDFLGRIEGLTNLDASELNPDLDDLKRIPKLRTLSLSGRKYNDEAAQAIADNFRSLESAYLRGTSITNAGVEQLAEIKTLTILTLDDSRIDDGVAASIRKMKQLTWLSVENCAVGDDTLAALSECPDMWYVYLVQTQVTDKGLANLPKLKKPLSLYLAHCKLVTDDGIKSLAQLTDSPNLHIALWGSSVTEKGIAELKAALPRADQLERPTNSIEGLGQVGLGVGLAFPPPELI